MNSEQQRAACAFLYQHWKDGTRCDGLPPDLCAADRAEAYRVQACIEDNSKRPPVGWKIAATSKAGQAHIGVDGPMAGRLLAERQILDGGSLVLGSNLMKVAEMEFAFRFGEDVMPRAQPYSQAEVLDRVSALHPAIELPDSRYDRFETVGDLQLIADNACAHLFVLGPAATADWRAMDLVEERPVITMRGEKFIGHGRNVLGDPRAALAWLANELRQLGVTLKAGRVVTTGTCHAPLPIKAGDFFAADFGALGKVSVGFA